MNEDTTNDQNNLQPWIDPELEARIVALVLGEASDFEREEIERLIAGQPELQFFKQRLEEVNGLLGEVAGEYQSDRKRDGGDEHWQLNTEKRQQLLDVFSGKVESPLAPDENAGAGESRVRPTLFSRLKWREAAKLAAVLLILIGVGAVIVQSVGTDKKNSVYLADNSSSSSMPPSSGNTNSEWYSFGFGAPAAGSDADEIDAPGLLADNTVATNDRRFSRSLPETQTWTGSAERADGADQAITGLSSIRESLKIGDDFVADRGGDGDGRQQSVPTSRAGWEDRYGEFGDRDGYDRGIGTNKTNGRSGIDNLRDLNRPIGDISGPVSNSTFAGNEFKNKDSGLQYFNGASGSRNTTKLDKSEEMRFVERGESTVNRDPGSVAKNSQLEGPLAASEKIAEDESDKLRRGQQGTQQPADGAEELAKLPKIAAVTPPKTRGLTLAIPKEENELEGREADELNQIIPNFELGFRMKESAGRSNGGASESAAERSTMDLFGSAAEGEVRESAPEPTGADNQSGPVVSVNAPQTPAPAPITATAGIDPIAGALPGGASKELEGRKMAEENLKFADAELGQTIRSGGAFRTTETVNGSALANGANKDLETKKNAAPPTTSEPTQFLSQFGRPAREDRELGEQRGGETHQNAAMGEPRGGDGEMLEEESTKESIRDDLDIAPVGSRLQDPAKPALRLSTGFAGKRDKDAVAGVAESKQGGSGSGVQTWDRDADTTYDDLTTRAALGPRQPEKPPGPATFSVPTAEKNGQASDASARSPDYGTRNQHSAEVKTETSYSESLRSYSMLERFDDQGENDGRVAIDGIEGKQAIASAGGISVEGKSRTKDRVIRRELIEEREQTPVARAVKGFSGDESAIRSDISHYDFDVNHNGVADGPDQLSLWWGKSTVDEERGRDRLERGGADEDGDRLTDDYRNSTDSYFRLFRSSGENSGIVANDGIEQKVHGTPFSIELSRGDSSRVTKSFESFREVDLKSGGQIHATNGRNEVNLSTVTTAIQDGKKRKSQRDDRRKRIEPPAGLSEKMAEQESFSTFSLHVSDVSFKLAQAALDKGEWPEADKIRIEEFVNAFDYGDPLPTQEEKVECRVEQAIHPTLQQRNILRIAMRTAAAGRAGDTPLRLTFLLDNSGSMERVDREETVRRAFGLLADQLQPTDQVSIFSFARQPRLLADQVTGQHASQLSDLVSGLPSEGGTNIELALRAAFEKAREQQDSNAQNRVVLLTDGAANLGDAKPESLAKIVEQMRNAGIAFDTAGIGADGLNDEVLEALTRKGDGRYYLLDQPEDADSGFAKQIAGALRPSAKNVKIQVEFNPERVGRYKLLGFEKHRLKKEDFRDDKVDAAEMAAE
ncbi:MAG: DUF3520 domain-containing protein, partial [Verrucomicrobiales bacterium]|nr:DUF3520 domain-containing protein [Verrucomicrobiales bacterium]